MLNTRVLLEMTNYAVLGLGFMGEAIVHDVLTFDNDSIVYGYEVNKTRRNLMQTKFNSFGKRFKTHHLQLDLKTPVEDNPLISHFKQNNITIVFGAIDYKYNLYLSKICINSGSNYFDLGGNPDVVRSQQKLNEEAKNAGVTIIPDLGLAPGMANILASYIMEQFESLTECHIRVGGLPQPEYKKSILKYQQVFSIRGLTNEYLEDAIVIRNGKIRTVKSMTEVEELHFEDPYNVLEAFQTSGGTSSLPELYEGKIDELTYKTIRYPGHAKFIQFLIEFELLSSEANEHLSNVNPREVIEYYLQKHLPKGDPDVVLMRITVSGRLNGAAKNITYNMIDKFDPKSGHTAMARTTSYPVAIVGQMAANNVIKEKGVLYSEKSIPGDELLKQLRRRDIQIDIMETEIK
jgi:lysine 6-dehydrogenase